MIPILLGITAGLAAYLLTVGWNRWKHRCRPSAEDCGRCGTTITGRQIHTITERPADSLEASFAGLGGTLVSMTVCRRCCTGGCDRRHRGKLRT